MARDLQTILDTEDQQQATLPELNDLNSPSQTSIYTMWKYFVGLCQLLLEQLIDKKIAEIEDIAKITPVGSEPWVQAKMFEFQYDAVVPQLIEIINPAAPAPGYAIVDPTKRIITRCSVITGANGSVLVKVAKQDPPAALTLTEKNAAQAYLTGGGNGSYSGRGRGIGFAGVNYIVSSFPPDFVYIAGTIFYNGQYSSTIQADVIAAINAYLSTIPFNGRVDILKLVDAIQATNGGLSVNDILLTDVGIRPSSIPFPPTTYLIQAKTQTLTSNDTFAGYAVGETAPNDLASVLIFTPS